MYSIGFDVHKKTISYCVKDGSGRIYAEVLTTWRFPRNRRKPSSRRHKGPRTFRSLICRFRAQRPITSTLSAMVVIDSKLAMRMDNTALIHSHSIASEK
jgi:hypothetical protein